MTDTATRKELVALIHGGNAHVSFDDAIAGFPAKLRGMKPDGSPHTAWQLLEHMRIALWDIVEFTRNPKHVSPDFPSGYWPATEAPPNGKSWAASISAFRKDLRTMQRIIEDPAKDLHAKLPRGSSQTIFREALVLADHNSYHLGQLMFLKRSLQG